MIRADYSLSIKRGWENMSEILCVKKLLCWS